MTGVRQTAGGVVQTSGGVAQTTVGGVLTIDSWEDSNYTDDYTSYTGGFGFDGTYVADGSVALYKDGGTNSNTFNRIVSNSGLPNYPSKGSIHNAYVRVSDTANVQYRQLFGAGTGDDDRYMAVIDFADGALELRRHTASSDTLLAFANEGVSAGTFYRVRVLWSDGSSRFSTGDDTITVELYDHGTGSTPTETGTFLDSVSATDATHATNTGWGVYLIGVDSAGQEAWMDHAYLEPES